MLEWEKPHKYSSIHKRQTITDFTNFPEYVEYPDEWNLDKVMGYPVNKFLMDTHLDDSFRKRFIDSFFHPTFAFATVLYSKSDPLRLLLALYTLLHFDIKHVEGWDFTEQESMVAMLKDEDFSKKEITLSDCHRVAEKIRAFYENDILKSYGGRYNKFRKVVKHITFEGDEYTNEVKLFAFMEDMADIGNDIVNVRNLYTVIGWFIEESNKIFPNSKVYHFKGIQNHRVHVNRSLLMKLITKKFPEVKWIKVVDDDDTHTSIRLLVKQFYTAFANDEALGRYNNYINKLREIRNRVNVGTIEELRKMENPYNFIINAGRFNGVSGRLYNTLCPNNINMLFNSYCVQGEDSISLVLYRDTLNMVHVETDTFLSECEYVLPSNRYESNNPESIRIMIVQHYLRILSSIDYDKAQEFRRRYNSTLPSTANIHTGLYLNEKKNMYEVLSVLTSEDLKQKWWMKWMKEGTGKADPVVYKAINRSLYYDNDRLYDIVREKSDLKEIFVSVERMNKVLTMFNDIYNGEDEAMKRHVDGFYAFKDEMNVYCDNFQRSRYILKYEKQFYDFIHEDLRNMCDVDDEIIEKHKMELIDIFNELFEEARKQVKETEEEERREREKIEEKRKHDWLTEKSNKWKEERKGKKMRIGPIIRGRPIVRERPLMGGRKTSFPFYNIHENDVKGLSSHDMYSGKHYFSKFLRVIGKIFYDVFEKEAKKYGVDLFDEVILIWASTPDTSGKIKIMDKSEMYDKVEEIYDYYYYYKSDGPYYISPFNLKKGLYIKPKHFNHNICIDKVEKVVNYPLFDVKYEINYDFAIPTFARSHIIERKKLIVSKENLPSLELPDIMMSGEYVRVSDSGGGDGEWDDAKRKWWSLYDWNEHMYYDESVMKLKGGKKMFWWKFIALMAMIVLVVVLVLKAMAMFKGEHVCGTSSPTSSIPLEKYKSK